MTRKEMVEAVMRQAGLTKANVERFYDGLAELARRELVRNKTFVLPGLGVLRVRARKARTGRNPRTGESIRIPARKMVRFRAYRPLDEALNGPRRSAASQPGGQQPEPLWPQPADEQAPPQSDT
jgi:DNA-binding protein HU-beta